MYVRDLLKIIDANKTKVFISKDDGEHMGKLLTREIAVERGRNMKKNIGNIGNITNCTTSVCGDRTMFVKSEHEYCTIRQIKIFGLTVGISAVFSRYSAVTGTLRKYNVHAYGNAVDIVVNEVINFIAK